MWARRKVRCAHEGPEVRSIRRSVSALPGFELSFNRRFCTRFSFSQSQEFSRNSVFERRRQIFFGVIPGLDSIFGGKAYQVRIRLDPQPGASSP